MKRIYKFILCVSLAFTLFSYGATAKGKYVTIDGKNLVQPNGKKLFIIGTNLGNWLNPEGYMFGFKKTNSYWMINHAICQMVGPDTADEFWSKFKDNYVTRRDIDYLASLGANTIRLPFNYKLFTDEDFMGLSVNQDGFARVDSLVSWCRDNHLYLILDMHDAPGGQTGDNIDDSYGYPWLLESEKSQSKFCDVWRKIADRYKDEPVILGYELLNEPIAPYFENMKDLNTKLEPLYKRAVKSIREVDNHHIILLGGAQWNGNFDVFSDWKFDDKIMYTCHRYGGGTDSKAIESIISFRDKTGLPMYMGETGHNTDEWQDSFCKMLRENNIGYTFWPYKKLDNSCVNAVVRPAEWDTIVVKFAESQRVTYKEIREARPNQQQAKSILNQYLEKIKCENCIPQIGYIKSIGLNAPEK